MGTASFSVTMPSKSRGQASSPRLSSTIVTSGAFTTSISAANLEDGGGDITLSAGQLLTIHADEAMRVDFAGTAATASTGIYIPAAGTVSIECNGDDAGLVSIIDVA